MQISLAVKASLTAKLINAFVFTTRIVQFLFFLNKKFQPSSLLLWLYRSVCVRPGQKPQRPVFSRCGLLNQKANDNSITVLLSGYLVCRFIDCQCCLDNVKIIGTLRTPNLGNFWSESLQCICVMILTNIIRFEPHHEEIGFLPVRKQRRRSAVQLLHS